MPLTLPLSYRDTEPYQHYLLKLSIADGIRTRNMWENGCYVGFLFCGRAPYIGPRTLSMRRDLSQLKKIFNLRLNLRMVHKKNS